LQITILWKRSRLLQSLPDLAFINRKTDAQRFLLFQVVPPGANTPATAATNQADPDPAVGLIVALNWASGLKK
jgi:hypothetical protein